jgi:hypothetical protein
LTDGQGAGFVNDGHAWLDVAAVVTSSEMKVHPEWRIRAAQDHIRAPAVTSESAARATASSRLSGAEMRPSVVGIDRAWPRW